MVLFLKRLRQPLQGTAVQKPASGREKWFVIENCVCVDFEIDFAHGGGIQGQDFRLDIDGTHIADDTLAAFVISDLRLLMVSKARILVKKIIDERHKRSSSPVTSDKGEYSRCVDLSHTIEEGMITYKGLPAPLLCDFLSREQSRHKYAHGTEFQSGSINTVGNTGSYLDTPFHRYAEGSNLSRSQTRDC